MNKEDLMKISDRRSFPHTIYYILPVIFFLVGCATVKEAGKGFLGVSTNVLEETRPQAEKEIFAIDMVSCYDKVKLALVDSKAYIYAEKSSPKMIAIYLTEDDTTCVGLFFSKNNLDQTLVEISSPSTYAKETVAKNVFGAMKQYIVKKDNPERKIDAQAEKLN
jgi:hypothetical protein